MTIYAQISAESSYVSPVGSGNACSFISPCSWQTAIASGQNVVFLDGKYNIDQIINIPEGKTYTAYNKWAAHVHFTECDQFHLTVSGTIKDLEITAPCSWSVIELLGNSALADGIFLHDANSRDDYLYPSSLLGTTPCVFQGAVDMAPGGTIQNSIIYDTGHRSGAESCSWYHPIYYGMSNTIQNNLIVDHAGGFCIHGWRPEDRNNTVNQNTVIGCSIIGIISHGDLSNVVTNNVITQANRGCVKNRLEGLLTAFNNRCTSSGFESSESGVVKTTIGLELIADGTGIPASQITAEFDAAITPAEKIAVAKKYSMNHATSDGAGYLYPDTEEAPSIPPAIGPTTSAHTPTPVHTPTANRLAFSSLSGKLTNYTISGSGDSGFIYTTEYNMNGEAEYIFQVLESGMYTIQLELNAKDGSSNSLYAGIDELPLREDQYISDIPITEGFQKIVLNQRGINGTPFQNTIQPLSFYLEPGKHTLYILSREANTQIRHITLQLQEMPTPISTPVPTIVPDPTSAPANQQTSDISGQLFEDVNQNGSYDPGEPVMASVTAILIDLGSNGQVTTVTTLTDQNGMYQFINVPEANYIISFALPVGYVHTRSNEIEIHNGTGVTNVPPVGVSRSIIDNFLYLPWSNNNSTTQE